MKIIYKKLEKYSFFALNLPKLRHFTPYFIANFTPFLRHNEKTLKIRNIIKVYFCAPLKG